MRVFFHHIYEYQKGLRRLILHTAPTECREVIEAKLKKNGISYLITDVTSKRINVFFGHQSCIEVIERFSSLNLSHLSIEEDFILGAMLGYDIKVQCERYIKLRDEETAKDKLAV